MFLFLLETNNLLLGFVPESIGLLLFGMALVAITVFLRWFLNENENEEIAEDKFEKIASKVNK